MFIYMKWLSDFKTEKGRRKKYFMELTFEYKIII